MAGTQGLRPLIKRRLVGISAGWLALSALVLAGCQGAGATIAPGGLRRAPTGALPHTTFTMAPLGGALPAATPLLAPPALTLQDPEALLPAGVTAVLPVTQAATTPTSGVRVRVLGLARVVGEVAGLVNVQDGRITGTPVVVRDARTGRRLAEAVTFYDGSFSLDVELEDATLPVILSTSLVDAGDPGLTTAITAPAVLRQDEVEHRVALTPGSTALTAFLEAVAGLQQGAAPGALEGAVSDPAVAAGPRLGALISAIDDGERESFARLAEAAPELKEASNVSALREGIRRFIGRIAVRKG
ncbi:MAG: hypothetical protein VKQ33_03415 [Candidatus Sericytochromatia bacterium]|nr:hypothetical protein [Candidatus Sericytochromatia bacterium]